MSLSRQILVATTLSLAALSVPMTEAKSSFRTFFNPAVFGKPVALCMSDRASCGKPSADTWCRDHGFAEALVFERALTMEKRQVFRQIKCISREQEVATTG